VLYVPCLRRRGLGAVGSIRGCGRTWSWSFPLSIGTLPTLRIIIQYGSSPSAVYLLILYTKHFQDMLRCRSEIPYQSLVSIRSLPETCSYTPNPSQPNVAGTHRIRLAVRAERLKRVLFLVPIKQCWVKRETNNAAHMTSLLPDPAGVG
jgi:hypothetical protein